MVFINSRKMFGEPCRQLADKWLLEKPHPSDLTILELQAPEDYFIPPIRT